MLLTVQFSSTFSLRSSLLRRAIPILVYFSNLVPYSIQNISCLSQQPTRHGSIVFCTWPQICLSILKVMQPCQIQSSSSPCRVCRTNMFCHTANFTICGSANKCACACVANSVVLIHAYRTLASLLSSSENAKPEANPAQSVSPSSISVLFCMHRKSNLPNPITPLFFVSDPFWLLALHLSMLKPFHSLSRPSASLQQSRPSECACSSGTPPEWSIHCLR